MASTLISRAAPAWLRELAAARTNYEELHGWPVSLEISTRTLTLLVGQTVDAVTMPTVLGAQVQFQLQLMMLDGPVIAGPVGGRLVFLTEPSIVTCPSLPTDLERAWVRPVIRGERIILPVARTASDQGEPRWFDPPRPCRKAPAWSVVVGASRRVVSSQAVDHSALPVLDRLAA